MQDIIYMTIRIRIRQQNGFCKINVILQKHYVKMKEVIVKRETAVARTLKNKFVDETLKSIKEMSKNEYIAQMSWGEYLQIIKK